MNWLNFKDNNWQRYRFSLLLFVVAALLLLYFTSDEITLSGNETSRLSLVESLGDRGVFQIDDSMFKTVDKGQIDGNFYSDKPMLYSLYLTGIYGVCRIFGMTFTHSYHDVIYLLNLLGGTLFAFLIMLLFYRRLRWHDHGGRTAAALLSIAGIFSTWIFSYCGIINNHVPAAFFLLLLYLLLDRQRLSPESWHVPVIGLCAGILISIEIPTGFFFTLATILYLLRANPVRWLTTLVEFGLSFAIPLFLMALVGLFVYGSPLPVYMVPGAYNFSGNIHSSDIAGLNRPEAPLLIYGFDILFGARGFFSYMPALLLIVPAIWTKRHSINSLKIFFITAILACSVFYWLMTGDYGGWAYGFRFAIPLIPLLWLWIAEWLLEKISWGWRLLFIFLTVIGLITSLVGAYNPWPSCKVQGRTMLFNTFAVNNYCAAYEYAPGSAWFDLSEKMFNQAQIRSYMLLAFSNTKKLDNEHSQDWPLYLQHRTTVPQQFFRAVLPSWQQLLTTISGAVFAWFTLLGAARLAPWMLGRKRLWLSPLEAIVLLAPPALLLSMIAVFLSYWCSGGLHCLTMAAAAVLLYLCLLLNAGKHRIIFRPIQWHHWSPIVLLVILPLATVLLLLATTMQTPPWSTDVLTYHLYIPLRWLQEQSFFTVPTVFGDSAAAYAPRNWLILSSACLELLPGDAVMEIATITFLALTVAAATLLVKECGGTSRAAQTTAVLVALSPLFLEYGVREQPDLAVTGLLAAGLYWMLKAQARRNRGTTLMAAMCCGLAVGLKTVVLPLVALPVIIILGRELHRRNWGIAVLATGIFLLSGGGWYLYNWVICGNPLFPLNIQLAGWTVFAGVYNSAAVQISEFHAGNICQLGTTVWKEYGAATTLMMLVGWIGWLWLAWRDRRHRYRLLLIGGHAWLWLAIYIWIIPHNLQTRFLFPSLLLALCGLGLWVNYGKRKWLALATAALTGILGMLFCIRRINILTDGCHVFTIFLAILLAIVAITMVMAWQSRNRPRRRTALLLIITILVLALVGAAHRGDELRSKFYQDLTGWEWLAKFNQPQMPATNIAYTGFNRPYLLVGPHLTNRVVYANVQGKVDDDFYRLWQSRPQLYDFYKPGLYRDRPDYQAWLRNLTQLHVQQLVITRQHVVERTYLNCDAEGWPRPEIDWTAAHPELFKLELSSPSVRIFRLRHPLQ